MPAARTLILLRHASAAGGYPDSQRPLTPDGVQDATLAGRWIRDHLPTVQAVLCSTAARTRQTLAATALQAPTNYLDELYGAGVDDILAAIGQVPDSVDTVLVVGHAPGIPATTSELATVAALDRDDPQPPDLAALRHFSACSLAVLTTGAPWSGLAEQGADVTLVRHPDSGG